METLIVGGGPAGLAAAKYLADAGPAARFSRNARSSAVNSRPGAIGTAIGSRAACTHFSAATRPCTRCSTTSGSRIRPVAAAHADLGAAAELQSRAGTAPRSSKNSTSSICRRRSTASARCSRRATSSTRSRRCSSRPERCRSFPRSRLRRAPRRPDLRRLASQARDDRAHAADVLRADGAGAQLYAGRQHLGRGAVARHGVLRLEQGREPGRLSRRTAIGAVHRPLADFCADAA